jgi:hypothetical protein
MFICRLIGCYQPTGEVHINSPERRRRCGSDFFNQHEIHMKITLNRHFTRTANNCINHFIVTSGKFERSFMNGYIKMHHPTSRLITTIALIVGATIAPTEVQAETPEHLDQLEPGNGEWQVEYAGQFGSSETVERPHGIEAYRGISDAIAVGVEIEGEVDDGDFRVGEFGLSLLTRFGSQEEGELGTGALLSASIDDEGNLSEAEARVIVEQKGDAWWGQANAMLRHVNEGGEKGELLAYGWNISRAVTDNVWLGVEGSGQAARLGGFAGGFERAHFAGPALLVELEPAEDKELEIGLAWFRRLGDNGARNTARLFVQFGF